MKKSLHPAAIAAPIAVFVVILVAVFVKFGNSEAHGVSMGDAMKTTHGNKVNSFTGEPLTETQKLAAERQEAMFAASQKTEPAHPGSSPNMGARDN